MTHIQAKPKSINKKKLRIEKEYVTQYSRFTMALWLLLNAGVWFWKFDCIHSFGQHKTLLHFKI